MVTRKIGSHGYPTARRTGRPPVHRAVASPRIARTTTEDLSTDSPLKDPENGGVTTPSDMPLEEGREEETMPGTPMVEGAVMNWFDELGS
jgi:hypothetical protein